MDINKSNLKNTFLIVEYPLLDHVNFYYQSNKEWNTIETGDNLPFASRIIKNKNFVFLLDESMESPILLKIKTEGPLFIPIKLISIPEYLDSLNKENYLWGIYFGIVSVFILYNLISYFSIKDNTYLFYILHIIAFTLLQAVLNGITFQFLWPDFPYFANISPNFFHSLSLFFILLFSIQFLKIKEYSLLTFRLILLLTGIYFSFLILSLYTPFYKFLLITQTYLIILSSTFILVISFLSQRKNLTPTKYYMAGWIVLFLAIIANRLKTLGYLPQNFVSAYGMLFASVLEMGFFSIALGKRILEIKQKTEESEREKQRLISDLHDNLGGDLTDIVYTLNKFVSKKNFQTDDIEQLRITSQKALNTLKTRIRSKEEIDLIEENLIDGIRLHIITRYSNTGRILKSFVDKNTELFFDKDNTILPHYNEIFLICKEVCTNDLKYGFGESHWNFSLENNVFSIKLSTSTNYNNPDKDGQGTNNLQKRVEKIGAKIFIERTGEKYELTFKMNVKPSTLIDF